MGPFKHNTPSCKHRQPTPHHTTPCLPSPLTFLWPPPPSSPRPRDKTCTTTGLWRWIHTVLSYLQDSNQEMDRTLANIQQYFIVKDSLNNRVRNEVFNLPNAK